jgi:hypothetical protein
MLPRRVEANTSCRSSLKRILERRIGEGEG